jgi:hypothetical protein
MTKLEARKLVKKIKKHVDAIAVHRAILRDISSELESIEQAHEEFEVALTTLSQYL